MISNIELHMYIYDHRNIISFDIILISLNHDHIRFNFIWYINGVVSIPSIVFSYAPIPVFYTTISQYVNWFFWMRMFFLIYFHIYCALFFFTTSPWIILFYNGYDVVDNKIFWFYVIYDYQKCRSVLTFL